MEIRAFSIPSSEEPEQRLERCRREAREALERFEGFSPEREEERRYVAGELTRAIKAASVAKALSGEQKDRELLRSLQRLRDEL